MLDKKLIHPRDMVLPARLVRKLEGKMAIKGGPRKAWESRLALKRTIKSNDATLADVTKKLDELNRLAKADRMGALLAQHKEIRERMRGSYGAGPSDTAVALLMLIDKMTGPGERIERLLVGRTARLAQ